MQSIFIERRSLFVCLLGCCLSAFFLSAFGSWIASKYSIPKKCWRLQIGLDCDEGWYIYILNSLLNLSCYQLCLRNVNKISWSRKRQDVLAGSGTLTWPAVLRSQKSETLTTALLSPKTCFTSTSYEASQETLEQRLNRWLLIREAIKCRRNTYHRVYNKQ